MYHLVSCGGPSGNEEDLCFLGGKLISDSRLHEMINVSANNETLPQHLGFMSRRCSRIGRFLQEEKTQN